MFAAMLIPDPVYQERDIFYKDNGVISRIFYVHDHEESSWFFGV